MNTEQFNQLEQIAEVEQKSIRGYVAEQALSAESPVIFFRCLIQHGYKCEAIPLLLDEGKTQQFFLQYQKEMESIRGKFQVLTALNIPLTDEVIVNFTRYAVEETAYQMAGELGLNVD